MTTPDDTTRPTETTDSTTIETPTETTSTETPTETTSTETPTETTSTETTSITDTSPRTIPGNTPITEEAGAPLVPTTTTDQTEPTSPESRFESPRGRSPPPADDERDAPLVPDLRPTRSPRTDGGSR